MALVAVSGCSKNSFNTASPDSTTTLPLSITLDDDRTNLFAWSSAATVYGNRDTLTITGTCGSFVESVQFLVGSTLASSVPCNSVSKFSVKIADNLKITTNGVYQFTFVAVVSPDRSVGDTAATRVVRTYDFKKVDPNALVAFDPVADQTSDDSVNVNVTCRADVHLSMGNQEFDCANGASESQAMALNPGVNDLMIRWADKYGNQGIRTFSVARNDPAAPEVLAGGLVSSSGPVALALDGVTAGSEGAPAIVQAVQGGFAGGPTSGRDIPLSLTLFDDTTLRNLGLTLSVSSASLDYCMVQSPATGACLPY